MLAASQTVSFVLIKHATNQLVIIQIVMQTVRTHTRSTHEFQSQKIATPTRCYGDGEKSTISATI